MDRLYHTQKPSALNISIWIIISFLIWIYCFRGFITGELAFDSDAVAYYQHIKFFIDNMVIGIYPLWDPSINSGVPNEFFLRRMGSFNPFFMIIVGLRKLGVPHLIAYNCYLAIYYFIGAIGFYKLSKLIFRNTMTAYLSFLILYFSSLGTRQFDSYIILVFVPLVWFFYFLISFVMKQQKHSLLGLTFCLMNLATTYIPLYFLVIFATFVIFGILVYPKESVQFLIRSFSFFDKNKLFSGFCAVVLLISLIPGTLIFLSAGNSEFVMPRRGFTAGSEHALEVGRKTITEWAVLEELVYTSAFVDLKMFKFAIIYFPGIIYLLLLLGMFAKINRKLLLMFIWGGFLFLLSVPDMTPVYGFLHEHIFFFKYFRNLHWFFWLAILPIFVLFAMEHFDQFIRLAEESKTKRKRLISFVICCHIIFGLLVYLLGNTLLTTYLMIVLSLTFCLLALNNVLYKRFHLTYLLLTLLVVVQSIEVYNYLNRNSIQRKGPYAGDIVHTPNQYTKNEKLELETGGQKASLYYSLKYFNDLYSNVNGEVLFQYKNNNFIVYDSTEYMDPALPDYSKIEDMFKNKLNHAYVHSNFSLAESRIGNGLNYQVLTEDSERFKILKATVDSIKIKTNFSEGKFLVFNNVFHRHWKAVLNGKPYEIIRANIAFQGINLPGGDNVLELRFGSPFLRGMNYSYVALFYGVFLLMVIVWNKEYKTQKLVANND